MSNTKNTATTSSNRKKASSRLMQKIINAGEDVKGFDTVALDVSEVFHLSDYFIILSGRSDRHVQGIVNSIQSELSAEIRRRLGRGESGSMSALGEEIEKLMLEQALAHTDGRKLKAAELLGVGRNTLTRKLKEHNMQNSG